MLINGVPRRLSSGNRAVTSAVSPECDSARTTSPGVIMPRSPWLASPGCTKKAGVPVLARVAAILPPMWPDLPMPVTTTRPEQARMSSQARSKPSSICSIKAPMACCSSVRVRMALARSWLEEEVASVIGEIVARRGVSLKDQVPAVAWPLPSQTR
ncbi:hypothetical protein A8U91_01625 [Halomonas elongata]|uniref:Uncharacterized protein n=1 Tax=Halomonas elongata TaxID=2746 RepID=A0A1B8P4T1_HALEL|nr:hypothetical protein A8U91_01625 [Halomonas elongata]